MLDDVSWFMSPERVDIVDIAKRTQNTGHSHPSRLWFPQRALRASLPFLLSHTRTTTCHTHRPRIRHYVLLGIQCSPATSPTHRVFRLLEGRIGNLQRIRTWISGDDRGAGRQGGRVIIVVSAEEGVEQASKRCLGESPLGYLLAERRRRLDRDGSMSRSRSVQQRFQKAVENPVEPLLAASTKIARAFGYQGVGTAKYLINSHTGKRHYGPRSRAHLASAFLRHPHVPRHHPIIHAPHRAAPYNCASLPKTLPRTSPSLSAGAIAAQFHRGSRGAIVVRGRDLALGNATRGAVRALQETSKEDDNEEGGVETNEGVVLRVMLRSDWGWGRASALGVWVWVAGNAAWRDIPPRPLPAWIQPISDAKQHTPTLASGAHTAFPIHLLGMLQSTFSPSSLAFSLKQGQSSTGISAGAFDLADPNDSAHVAAALTGKTVGLHLAVWLSGVVAKGDAIVVLSATKMKSVVVVPGGGRALMWERRPQALVTQNRNLVLVLVHQPPHASHSSRQVFSGIEQGLNKVVVLQTPALDKLPPPSTLPRDLCRHKAHGRRIRVVSAEEDIEEVFKRCMGESPSGQLFSEKALSVPGWKHIEVQAVGDAAGDVAHLRELRGSVQRQFQKVVENPKYPMMYLTDKRIAVIIEELTNLDIMRIQLLLSFATLASLNLISASINLPQVCPMQSGLTAEDLAKDFRLSAVTIPAQLRPGPCDMEFASRRGSAARVVVRGRDIGEGGACPAGEKSGDEEDDEEGKCDMMRFQRELEDATGIRTVVLEPRVGVFGLKGQPYADEVAVTLVPGVGIASRQPGAISHLVVSPPGSKTTSAANKHTVTLASIAHNPSPTDLSGTRQSIFSASATVFLLKQEQSSAGVQAGAFDRADPNDSTQVAAATGKIVEPHPTVWLSGVVAEEDMIAVLSMMEVESVAVVPCGGRTLMWGRWLGR
ncbi:hypothetical protein FIBSPDRAFT_941115 [Athelia psychrophila]|uniref:Carbamoyl phosphate synthase ATP-binding domain-containing protein n=1 Tax=Athelia psychrophila TaxID=1759441 RepID=A0A167URT7_9AGAM|nr:hypothetical protein FIBSPDRAFT_941115 [Fibularhizoctonia sp. CBS 109695]